MTTLVIGSSGATGKLLVEQLLKAGQKVKVIVRPSGDIPNSWSNNENISILKANITEIGVDKMAEHLKDCRAVASCLGHNLTIKGIFGKPGRLVTDAVSLICEAIKKNAPDKPVIFVLMNTVAVRNKDIAEFFSAREKIVMGLISFLLPPQKDNENAADYLRVNVGQNNPYIEWAVVRPDSLINAENVSEYSIPDSPARSGIFNPGKTSRINAGNFMARLITEDDLWEKWKGKMPVIYNV